MLGRFHMKKLARTHLELDLLIDWNTVVTWNGCLTLTCFSSRILAFVDDLVQTIFHFFP